MPVLAIFLSIILYWGYVLILLLKKSSFNKPIWIALLFQADNSPSKEQRTHHRQQSEDYMLEVSDHFPCNPVLIA